MKNQIVLFLAFILPLGLSAQLEPHFTHFSFFSSQTNPAVAGSGNEISVTAIHRSQWLGLTNSNLNTQGISGSIPITRINSGVGFFVLRDHVGHQSMIYTGLDFAYRLGFGDFSLGLGVRGGATFGNLDGAKLRAPEGTYGGGVIDHSDAILPQSASNGIGGDLGFGLHLEGKGLRLGFGMTHLMSSPVNIDFPGGSTQITIARTFSFSAGYDIAVSRVVEIPVDFFIRTDFVRTQMDFQARVVFNQNLWVGLSARGYSNSSFDAVSGMFGFYIKKKVGIGYSYDLSTSSLNAFNSGSHEILLTIRNPLKEKKRPGRIIYNPRFL